MEKRFVVYRGQKMIEGWPEKIQAAQKELAYDIKGKPYPRVRYGSEPEDWGAEAQPCHDCRVIKGELHVPGCDVECCPACGGQAITCECLDDEE